MFKESMKNMTEINKKYSQRLKLKNHIENAELKLFIVTCFDVAI